MAAFLDQTAALGDKRGPILVQLPPSLVFDATVAGAFFAVLRRRYAGPLALEPRHASWFGPEAESLLQDVAVARVAADPAKVVAAGAPGGDPALTYWRWHGSPHMYRSSYDDGRLDMLADRLRAAPGETWVVFDNTASGAAAADALKLQALI